MQVKLKTIILNDFNNDLDREVIVALGAKLCYSPSSIYELTEKLTTKDQSKFIDKLMEMNHLSPVEHVSFTFGIEGVSRALLAQITRHRIASFSVQSQRYVSADSFNYIVPQGIEKLGTEAVETFKKQMETIQGYYNHWQGLLGKSESGNEDARFVLPNAAETKFILTMNARELLHFFSLRCCFRAQWEIRELAYSMLKLVKAKAPNIFRYAGPSCAYGQCTEGKMSCGKAKDVKERHKQLEENK